MKIFRLSTTITFILLTLCSTSFGQLYAAWQNNATYKILTGSDFADIPTGQSVTNFSVLLRLDSSAFDFSQAAVDGADVRFSNAAGNAALSYYLQSWSSANKVALVWILIPTINGDQILDISMYWNNSSATSESNASAVFNGANGYIGVWHLDEDGNTTANGYTDATGVLHGTGTGFTNNSDQPGMIGNGSTFDGGSTRINIPHHASTALTKNVTISAWIKPESLADWVGIVTKGVNSGPYAMQTWGDGSLRMATNWAPAGTNNQNFNSTGKITAKFWTHVAVKYDGTNIGFYINGVKDANAPAATISFDQIAEDLVFGADLPGGDEYYSGMMDEIRLSNTPRSDAWMKLEYENQKTGQTLISLPQVNGCQDSFAVVSDTVLINEATAGSMEVIANCALKVSWVVVVGNTETVLGVEGTAAVIPASARVTNDSIVNLKVKAYYGTAWQELPVTLVIKNSIVEPIFSLDIPVDSTNVWNGLDTLEVIPNITNLAAVLASPPPGNQLNYNWSYRGSVSRIETDSSVLLTVGISNGPLAVTLCLDNGGPKVCVSDTISIQKPAPLEVLSPNGGETYQAGDTVEVTWANSVVVTNVHIQYSIDGGNNWLLISANETNVHSYFWEVPSTATVGGRVRVINAVGGGPLDESNGNFTIEAPTSVSLNKNERFYLKINGFTKVIDIHSVNVLTIRDVHGRLIERQPIHSNSWASNIIIITNGIYLIELESEENFKTRLILPITN